MAAKEPTGFQKSIIFIYSASVAILGYHSYSSKHGSFFEYLSRDSVASASESKKEKGNFLKFFQRKENAKGSKAPINTPEPHSIQVSEKGEKLDSLTDNDRKALSTLIDGL